MSNYQETLDELFVDKLGYDQVYQDLPIPEIDGSENIISYRQDYHSNGLDIIVVECQDRIIEFQKKLIKTEKSSYAHAHFLFVSNNGKIYDLYNDAGSKKLKKITYNEIDKNTRLFNEKIQLFDVTQSADGTDLQISAEKAFDANDKVTKKFFDRFKKIHDKLQKAITGIDDEKDKSWYASVMMNRIMFIYFLQKHKVIQGNTNFLLDKFETIKKTDKDYYRDFLLPLFFYGFAKRDEAEQKILFTKEYGPIRYLNGGLFYPHHLEKKYTSENIVVTPVQEKTLQTFINIDNKSIKEVLEFLNEYTWYLDNRPMQDDKDINPDVLGYIFEKYINQKELGAYYTKEDITEYISKNTIIPFILDKMRRKGFDAPEPTQLITNNSDIIGTLGNYIDSIKNLNEAKFLYKDVLLELSVLDPSVGSGAFLFAGLNILLPVYQKTVFKLKEFAKIEDDSWLEEIIQELGKHPEEYFLTKQIILNNLHGVDIVEEAIEICKLRLFLQLASHLPDITSIEPLPDIDFNIYSGNSLVGGLNREDLERNYTMDLFTSSNWEATKINIENLSKLKTQYRKTQQRDNDLDELKMIKDDIEKLETQVNHNINIGVKDPFHWFIDFKSIMDKGGFDVIIGNPPYVEYSKVRTNYEIKGYSTLKSGNLYAFFNERSYGILSSGGWVGLIEPISLICTKRMQGAQNFIIKKSKNIWFSSYAERPSKLFTGADVSLTIILAQSGANANLYTTKYHKWKADDRINLFNNIQYTEVSNLKKEFSVPKISSEIAKNILFKINKENKTIGDYAQILGDYELIYRNAGGRYFKIALDFEPKFLLNDVEKSSTTYHKLLFNTSDVRNSICALMNSTLFYWYWIVYSDTWHMVKSDILPFPVELDEKLIHELNKLHFLLKEDFEIKSEKKEEFRNKGNDKISYTKYFARNSKNIIDEIDRVLGDHYGFTEEEMNFIINFDIEYRQEQED